MNYNLRSKKKFLDTVESNVLESDVNNYIANMTEVDINESILEEDLIYDYLINEANNETFVVGHINTFNVDKYENCESINEIDRNNANLYYDEDNLETLISKLDLNVEVNIPLTFVQTSRSGRKLIHDGYSYIKDRGDYKLTQWKCCFSVQVFDGSKKKYVYCPGRCHTYNDSDLKIITNHNANFHLPDPVETECLIVQDKMKIMEKISSEKPRSIIKACQTSLSEEAAARMKRNACLIQMMTRIRSTKPTYGPNPLTLAEIVVPTPLSFTYNNEPFVWKDSGYGDVDRIILFTTEKNIKLMLSNKEWFMDDI